MCIIGDTGAESAGGGPTSSGPVSMAFAPIAVRLLAWHVGAEPPPVSDTGSRWPDSHRTDAA